MSSVTPAKTTLPHNNPPPMTAMAAQAGPEGHRRKATSAAPWTHRGHTVIGAKCWPEGKQVEALVQSKIQSGSIETSETSVTVEQPRCSYRSQWKRTDRHTKTKKSQTDPREEQLSLTQKSKIPRQSQLETPLDDSWENGCQPNASERECSHCWGWGVSLLFTFCPASEDGEGPLGLQWAARVMRVSNYCE